MLRSSLTSLRLLSRRDKAVYLALLFCRIGLNFLDIAGLAGVGLLGSMVAEGFKGGASASFLSFEVPVDSPRYFLLVVLAIVAAFLAKSIFGGVLLRMTTVFLSKVERDFSAELVEAIFGGNLSRLNRHSPGRVQWLTVASSRIAFSSVLYSLANLFAESALFVTVLIGFVIVDWRASVQLALYFALLVALFHWLINSRLNRLGERVARASVEMSDYSLGLISSFRELHTANKLRDFTNHFNQARSQLARDSGNQRFAMGIPRYFIEGALMVGILAITLVQFYWGNLEQGLIITGVILAGGTRLIGALLPLQNSLSDLRVSLPQAQEAYNLIEESRLAPQSFDGHSELVPDLLRPASVRETAAEVAVKSVFFRHENGGDFELTDVSFEVKPGQVLAIVGPSGAGKSTLVDLLLGLLKPISGLIRVDGLSPLNLIEKGPQSISYVPQNPSILPISVAENVALETNREAINEVRLEECLRSVKLWELVSRLPRGLDTLLDGREARLSGGEAQRLSLARALYPSPRLLVLDEATSALDLDTENAIGEILKAIKGNTTTVLIAHRLTTVKIADVICVIEDGKVGAFGDYKKVKEISPLFQRYLELHNTSGK